MKILLSIVLVVFLQSAYADGPCVGLSNFVGDYKQVSKSCDHTWIGPTLSVIPFDKDNSWPDSVGNGYWLYSAGTGFGPTTFTDGTDLDKCTLSGKKVVVEICGNSKDNSCLPHKGSVSYIFSDSQVTFIADKCSAIYAK